jgi:hypothetical protein
LIWLDDVKRIVSTMRNTSTKGSFSSEISYSPAERLPRVMAQNCALMPDQADSSKKSLQAW